VKYFIYSEALHPNQLKERAPEATFLYRAYVPDHTLAFPRWSSQWRGGLASIVGSILGPLILILFNESLRFTGLPSDFSGPTQQMLYGLLLVVLMLFRRQGLVGKYEFHE